MNGLLGSATRVGIVLLIAATVILYVNSLGGAAVVTDALTRLMADLASSARYIVRSTVG